MITRCGCTYLHKSILSKSWTRKCGGGAKKTWVCYFLNCFTNRQYQSSINERHNDVRIIFFCKNIKTKLCITNTIKGHKTSNVFPHSNISESNSYSTSSNMVAKPTTAKHHCPQTCNFSASIIHFTWSQKITHTVYNYNVFTVPHSVLLPCQLFTILGLGLQYSLNDCLWKTFYSCCYSSISHHPVCSPFNLAIKTCVISIPLVTCANQGSKLIVTVFQAHEILHK